MGTDAEPGRDVLDRSNRGLGEGDRPIRGGTSPFLGACALHPRAGLTAHDAQEAAIKRAMVEGAARRIVLTDATKLDVVAPSAVASLQELDLVVSDAQPAWLRAAVKVERV